ncbi:hypothetical protein C9926_01790 [Sulfurovum lithotrophicum]|nr:hypothetical protein C9926_01790 [Sulfurovum lithotrophicum]
MKLSHIHLLGLITASILVGCGGTDGSSTSTPSSVGTTSTATGTTTQCRDIAPTLQSLTRQYASSKDDYETYNAAYTTYKSSKGSGDSDESGGSHNEGRNCLACHSFTSAGTVFTSLNAADNTPGAAGYRIQLNGSIVYSIGRGTGNSLTSSFPAGNFTAQVIDPNGNVVNSSADMSHDASRRACNTCHSSTGNSGAPGRITSMRVAAPTSVTPPGSTASVCVSFNSNVMPILEAKCKSCHGFNGRFTITTANATYANISSLSGDAISGGTYLLDKGSNSVGHGGGTVISTSSAEYTTIKAWITEGALNN